jgi:hypothetical protein
MTRPGFRTGKASVPPDDNGLICWHDQPRWDCDHFSDDRRDAYIRWGRCRSGRRWFWTAAESLADDTALHGDASTEDEAIIAAREAVARIAAGRPAVAEMRHGDASRLLRELNAARRASRPPSGSTDAGAVEYVFGTNLYYPDDWTVSEVREAVPYRVTRKTARRVYYLRDELHGQAGYVDREALERDGFAVRRSARWHEHDSTVYATREAAEHALGLDKPAAATPDLRQLRLDMANAHPDRGGDPEQFAAARKRYERAKAAAERMAS